MKRIGLTLIEVLVGLIIVSLLLIPLMRVFGFSYKESRKLFIRKEALLIASSRLDALRKLNFKENFDISPQAEVVYESGEGASDEMKKLLEIYHSKKYNIDYHFKLKITLDPMVYTNPFFEPKKLDRGTATVAADFVKLDLTVSWDENVKGISLCCFVGGTGQIREEGGK